MVHAALYFIRCTCTLYFTHVLYTLPLALYNAAVIYLLEWLHPSKRINESAVEMVRRPRWIKRLHHTRRTSYMWAQL